MKCIKTLLKFFNRVGCTGNTHQFDLCELAVNKSILTLLRFETTNVNISLFSKNHFDTNPWDQGFPITYATFIVNQSLMKNHFYSLFSSDKKMIGMATTLSFALPLEKCFFKS